MQKDSWGYRGRQAALTRTTRDHGVLSNATPSRLDDGRVLLRKGPRPAMAVTRSLRGVMDNWGMALGAKGKWKAGAAEPRDLSLALQLLITTGQVPGGLSPTR